MKSILIKPLILSLFIWVANAEIKTAYSYTQKERIDVQLSIPADIYTVRVRKVDKEGKERTSVTLSEICSKLKDVVELTEKDLDGKDSYKLKKDFQINSEVPVVVDAVLYRGSYTLVIKAEGNVIQFAGSNLSAYLVPNAKAKLSPKKPQTAEAGKPGDSLNEKNNPDGVKGDDAGDLVIFAQRVEGSLNSNSSGEVGGNGSSGNHGGAGIAGTNGAKKTSKDVYKSAPHDKIFGKLPGKKDEFFTVDHIKHLSPGRGGPATLPGRRGNGGDGGSGGRIIFEVASYDLKLDCEISGGAPGNPGEKSGDAGEPGQPGERGTFTDELGNLTYSPVGEAGNSFDDPKNPHPQMKEYLDIVTNKTVKKAAPGKRGDILFLNEINQPKGVEISNSEKGSDF